MLNLNMSLKIVYHPPFLR